MPMFNDTLLVLPSYPDPTPDRVIEQAAAIAQRIGSGISAIVPVLERSKIARSYMHGTWLMDVPQLIDDALQKSSQAADRLLDDFERVARSRGCLRETIRVGTSFFASSDQITRHARLRDLTFLPVPEFIGLDELYTEGVIFGSGRPAILLPTTGANRAPMSELNCAVVAWDFSRAASRALADAMPILEAAKQVRVVIFSNEKDIEDLSTKDLERHLNSHGVKGNFDVINAESQPIGTAISSYVTSCQADLLVMGAFGHSRTMEFVLGGATRSILKAPPVPVFLSY